MEFEKFPVFCFMLFIFSSFFSSPVMMATRASGDGAVSCFFDFSQ